MTDTAALRKAIEESGLKYGRIAREMGISAYTLQKKIDNIVEFKASEIDKLSSLLSLDEMARSSIFFAKGVTENHVASAWQREVDRIEAEKEMEA